VKDTLATGSFQDCPVSVYGAVSCRCLQLSAYNSRSATPDSASRLRRRCHSRPRGSEPVRLTPEGGHLTGGTAGPTGRLSACRASGGSTPRSFGSRLPAWPGRARRRACALTARILGSVDDRCQHPVVIEEHDNAVRDQPTSQPLVAQRIRQFAHHGDCGTYLLRQTVIGPVCDGPSPAQIGCLSTSITSPLISRS
jgi:hypothetical protein